MAFAIGQIVDLLDGHGYPNLIQDGDRATILMVEPYWVTVRCHRIDRVLLMKEDCLRLAVPLATPGRCGSVDVLLALQTVMREEQPHAVTELRREVERLRRTLAVQQELNVSNTHSLDVLRRERRDLILREERAVARTSGVSVHAREVIGDFPRLGPSNSDVTRAQVDAILARGVIGDIHHNPANTGVFHTLVWAVLAMDSAYDDERAIIIIE